MPTTSLPSNDGGTALLSGLAFIVISIFQIMRPFALADRYEATTGKPLPAARRAEVRLRAAKAAIPLLIATEFFVGLLISPIGWLTFISIGLFQIIVPIQMVRGLEHRLGRLSGRGWLRFALALWPAYLYLAIALLSWPIPQFIPDQAAHTVAPGVLYFIGWAIVLLYSPVGWTLFVASGLAILAAAVIVMRGAGPVKLSRRLALLWRGWPGLALIAVALFFWPLSTVLPHDTSTSAALTSGAGATTTPLATGTVSPLIRGAVLGAPQDAFDTAFGPGQPLMIQTVEQSLVYHATSGGAAMDLTVSFAPGRDGNMRAMSMAARQPIQTIGTPTTWDESAALTLLKTLLPPDAQPQGTDIEDSGNILLYHSAALASAFDPAYFLNADGSAAHAGTLQLQCQPPDTNSLPLGQCILRLGGE